MLYYALMFLLLGLVAAALGFSGIAGVATQISWVLFVVGIVLLIIHVVQGRSPRGTQRGWLFAGFAVSTNPAIHVLGFGGFPAATALSAFSLARR